MIGDAGLAQRSETMPPANCNFWDYLRSGERIPISSIGKKDITHIPHTIHLAGMTFLGEIMRKKREEEVRVRRRANKLRSNRLYEFCKILS